MTQPGSGINQQGTTVMQNGSDMGEVPYVDLPYAQRQFVVVVPDAVVEAERRELHEAQRREAFEAEHRPSSQNSPAVRKRFSLARIATSASEFVGSTSDLLSTRARHLAEHVRQRREPLYRLRAKGVPVLKLARSEAVNLTFPIGHPRDRVLYAGNPAVPNMYYTTALFHRLTFEHKFSEAVAMLMALGASEFKVQHVRGWSSEFAASLNVLLPIIGVDTDRSKASTSHILYTASLTGTETPTLPDTLFWYHHEPTWRQIADGRMKYGLQKFSLTVRYEEDYGVSTKLGALIPQVGLDIGGKFEEHKRTVWRISGKFGG